MATAALSLSLSLSLTSFANALPSLVCSSNASFTGNTASLRPVASPVFRFRPVKTLMMAKREQELEELRKMSDQELKDSVVELKGELIVLRMKQVARQEIKTSEFRRMRKRIARMLTVHRERELLQGIKKRDSRKLDRAWKRSIVVKPPPSLVALMEKRKKAEK